MLNNKFKIDIPTEALEALNILEKNNYEAWLVGGYIRDAINNSLNATSDIDIATVAKTAEIKKTFNNKNWTIYELGEKFGTVGLIYKKTNTKIEITTYRSEDLYNDNRHPQNIEFVSSIEKDLKRRDFTCNAIAYNPNKGIYDPFNGIDDIKANLIRCVGNPDDRLKEDYLRILRAIRFASQLGYTIESKTETALNSLKQKILTISEERIREEITKLICGKNAAKVLNDYKDILFILIPKLKKLDGFDQKTKFHNLDIYQHTIVVLDKISDLLDNERLKKFDKEQITLISKWSALLHDIGKPDCFTIDEAGQGHFYGHPKISAQIAYKILKDLKFPNKTINAICLLIRWHDYPLNCSKKSIKKLLRKFQETNVELDAYALFRIYCGLRKADSYAHSPNYRENLTITENIENLLNEIIEENAAFSLKDLAINGRYIISVGIKPGPEISQILNACLDAVIEEKILNNKDDLMNYIDENLC